LIAFANSLATNTYNIRSRIYTVGLGRD
jgi:hypothetical protein